MTNKLVLVIGGAEDLRQVTQLVLETTAGWEVLTVNSGLVGINLAAEVQPDAIVLDASVSDLSVAAALEQLRTNSATANIPIIVMTPRVRNYDRSEFSRMGAADAIAQPFDATRLARQIATTLGWNLCSC